MLTKPIHSFFANTEEFVQDKDVRRSILANSIKALPGDYNPFWSASLEEWEIDFEAMRL